MTTDIDNPPHTETALPETLKIDCPSPATLYAAMINQLGTTDRLTQLAGEVVGKVDFQDLNGPILSAESSVRAGKTRERTEEIPNDPGHFRFVGEEIMEFDVETDFRLKDHTFIGENETTAIIGIFRKEGYEVGLEQIPNGARRLKVANMNARFEIFIGWQDEHSLLRQKTKEIEEYRSTYPSLVHIAETDIGNILEKKDKSYVRIGVENSHPTRGPSGRKIESQEQVVTYIEEARKLSELTASAIYSQLSPGMFSKEVKMGWKSDKVQPTVWGSTESPQTIEELDNIPIGDLNESLIRVIQGLQKENFTPDLVLEGGINKNAQKVLTTLEDYFKGKKIGPDDIDKLNSRDQAYLALALALKSAESAAIDPIREKFTPNPNPEVAGVTFKMFGDNQRNRLEFFMQQDRKFSYNRSDSEAARFFLLHTTFAGQEDGLTRYERIQSENLLKAREYIFNELELRKFADYSIEDVKKINSILLTGLVPERNLGQIRQSENTKVGNRIGATDPALIELNLNKLLKSSCKIVNDIGIGDVKTSEDDKFKTLARLWASFDGIHPMEEGNGRTGTLIFESWMRLMMGRIKKFTSERKDTWKLAGAISAALTGDALEFSYSETGGCIKDENLDRLVDYIKEHTVDDWSQV